MSMLFLINILVDLFILSMIKMTSSDNNLRLYNSFAEIQQIYTEPLRFHESDWNNIKQESIIIRPVKDINNMNITFERRVIRLTVNRTGQRIFVRKYPEQKHAISCEMIREDHEYSIVREIETGHYLRIQSNFIEYLTEPERNSIYEVSFYPIIKNLSSIVTYTINSLQWNPRYSLQIFPNGQTQFQILADIINTSPLLYHFNQTSLISGNINLVFNNEKTSSSLTLPTKNSFKKLTDYNNGVYLFSLINGSLIIEPHSILTLPIVLPNICIKILFTYTLILTIPLSITNNMISSLTDKHKFQRLYQISNSSFYLPSGHLLLYDSSSKILTGEWQLPSISESDKYEFILGYDSDIILISNQTTNSSLITTNILIQNYKQQKIHIRFKSQCHSSIKCLFYDNKQRSLGSHLRYDPIIEAKSEVAFTFTTVRLS